MTLTFNILSHCVAQFGTTYFFIPLYTLFVMDGECHGMVMECYVKAVIWDITWILLESFNYVNKSIWKQISCWLFAEANFSKFCKLSARLFREYTSHFAIIFQIFQLCVLKQWEYKNYRYRNVQVQVFIQMMKQSK